jgi:hypothetical protein
VKLTVLLADSGQSDASGKAHILGLGWTIIDAPTTQPMAVVVIVQFDELTDSPAGQHDIVLRLIDETGSPVEYPDSQEAVVLRAAIELQNRIDNVPVEAPTTASLVVNIGPGLPLLPGQRYRWQAEIDGAAEHRADALFVTRAIAGAAP